MQPGSAPTETYDVQFSEKVERTRDQFKDFFNGEIDAFRSPASEYRMRAEFKIWHDKDTGRACYAMHQPKVKNQVIPIEDFEIGSARIRELMPDVLAAVNNSTLLKQKLFQIEFLTATSGDAVVSLIYHRALSEQWQAEAEQLQSTLRCQLIGRSRKQKIALGRDYVLETLLVNDKSYTYQQVETGFTQPNAAVCQKMLTWAQAVSADFGGDLLELYCGNGNFTLPLAQNFSRVLATEVSKTSVKSALYNIEQNGATNIAIARLSSEEFTEAMNKVRRFRRLENIDLDSYQFSTIFVDPPRAGLDTDTVKLASRFDNIIYISCNPDTLADNLASLATTHEVTRLALFDQFPYTEHRECGVILRRK
ncbi:tRNA (uridine(54)-C5)-methyltransferase TrmA [Teredinibacter turnerae]|uniref:tRNA (uridine(54)-C5)-methyltransferase TrmA n=1 Tax=Teredinibacter turnerae TaxID=2426 RepID=UPI000364909E|nr:tRNA (uridine(54)-C5)-methyltransferase TrmA [Teredinibacter turnerae]